MSLIDINGTNPFDGQKDPYLSLDSTINYSENPNGQIQNTYTLEGLLTGCNKQTLNNLRDDLVRSFDWKEDPTIPNNISIDGVISASSNQQIIPASIDFENSNYIGALSYTIKLNVFTGVLDQADDEDLINKTHTETTTINEKGCVNINTNISCVPNQNLTGCGALDAANAWIQKQLGRAQIGSISRQKSYPLQNESLTISPITSEVSYTSSHGHECAEGNEKKDEVPGGDGLQIAQCVETETERPECKKAISISRHQGEIYKKGADSDQLLGVLKNRILGNHQNIKNLNTQYSSDSITFSFEVKSRDGEPVYEPTDQIINDYTRTVDQDHDAGTTTISVNGSYKLENPKDKTKDDVLDISNEEIAGTAASIAGPGGLDLKSESITRSPQQGSVSYSFSWGTPQNFDEDSDDNLIKGVYNYSISVSEAMKQYSIIPVLDPDCPDYIIDLGYCSKGTITVSTTYPTGSDGASAGDAIIQGAVAKYGGANLAVTEDTTTASKDSIARNYAATFDANQC